MRIKERTIEKQIVIVFALLLSVWQRAVADVVIDMQAHGMNTRFMMNQQFARLDNAADGSYLLHERDTGLNYLVLPQSRQWMPLASGGINFARRLKLQLLPQPGERELHGFSAQRYRMFTNGQYCGEVFASKQASIQLNLQPMLKAAAMLADQQLSAMGIYVVALDSCTQAAMSIMSHSEQIGLPLRMQDKNGVLLSEIVRIDTNARLDSTRLGLPQDYRRVATVEQLSASGQRVQNIRRSAPAADQAYHRFSVPR